MCTYINCFVDCYDTSLTVFLFVFVSHFSLLVFVCLLWLTRCKNNYQFVTFYLSI